MNTAKGIQQLGHQLRRARERQKVTQLMLAKVTGLRTATISDLEIGRGDPKLSTILKIAYWLKIQTIRLTREK